MIKHFMLKDKINIKIEISHINNLNISDKVEKS